MHNWFHLFPKSTGLSLYAWLIFCLLPFYFIIRFSTVAEVGLGIVMIVLFFTVYTLTFIRHGWPLYVSVSLQMVISAGMTLYFGYVYFFLFLAFFIGNVRSRPGFISLYVVHLVLSLGVVTAGFFLQQEMYMMQLPFIFISVIGMILLPPVIASRNRQEQLRSQLELANARISELVVVEERQRIARDLHDTLGQKLSLIGLKSELAGQLIDKKPEKAKKEVDDIHQTARLALKEVRDMVSDMRGIRLRDEMVHVRELLQAAQIECRFHGEEEIRDVPLLVENTLSMCLKEAVTNVVKHSYAEVCEITVTQEDQGVRVRVSDDGAGLADVPFARKKSGLKGMKERLEFVNGTLTVDGNAGTTLTMFVPTNVRPSDTEEAGT
ncbi:sensor histidine kinase [Alkalicoccus urumqiensis]|uniref:histidine kinase n=1 Tax=Alkalicoccus urumqiensis TaxID=1548213 RepID=A0A2P6MJ86_ALKUR|nr:sensor histidine kinase [Alkalicoccus urumqiensis]PRO66320.1 sensor histidine kinase [Alkalicoccus urumqiensis]